MKSKNIRKLFLNFFEAHDHKIIDSSSVVINNDPEAPFFKAADYGIIGDAFDIVPKLNEKLKAFKAGNN